MRRWLLLGCVCIFVGAARGEDAKFDFRKKQFDEGWFRHVGADATKYIQFEDEGMRIRFPAGDTPKEAIGIHWNCRLGGEFTVSAHFEILQAESTGQGTGAEMWLHLENEHQDGLPISRLLRTGEGRCFTFVRMTGPRNSRKPLGWKALPAASTSERGWLRIERKGNIVIGSKAEGDDGPFEEISRFEIADCEVRTIRFAGLTPRNQNAALDLRLLEFNLQGTLIGLPPRLAPIAPIGAVEGPAVTPPVARAWTLWIVVVLGGLTLLLLLAVIAIVALSRMKGQTAMKTIKAKK
jgi:hypothetical protein